MGDHVGSARYARVLDRLTDGEALYGELRGSGADSFLATEEFLTPDLLGSASWTRRFQLAYAGGGVLLFVLETAALSSD